MQLPFVASKHRLQTVNLLLKFLKDLGITPAHAHESRICLVKRVSQGLFPEQTNTGAVSLVRKRCTVPLKGKDEHIREDYG